MRSPHGGKNYPANQICTCASWHLERFSRLLRTHGGFTNRRKGPVREPQVLFSVCFRAVCHPRYPRSGKHDDDDGADDGSWARRVTVVSSAGGEKKVLSSLGSHTPCLITESEIYNFMPLPFYWLLRIRRGSTGKVSDQWGTGAPIYDNQNVIFILSSPAWNVTFKPPHCRTHAPILALFS